MICLRQLCVFAFIIHFNEIFLWQWKKKLPECQSSWIFGSSQWLSIIYPTYFLLFVAAFLLMACKPMFFSVFLCIQYSFKHLRRKNSVLSWNRKNVKRFSWSCYLLTRPEFKPVSWQRYCILNCLMIRE
jgi:hypothetical protein